MNERRVAGLQTVEELPQQADLQALERLFQRGRIVRNRCIDAGRVLRIESGHGLQHDGRIRRAAGEHPGLVEARGEGNHAVARHAAIGRFDAGHTRQRGRLTNRAAGIGAGGEGRQPRRRRRRRSAGRAAGDLGRVPGILDRPVVAGLVGGAHGELVHIGLAQHDGAGRLERASPPSHRRARRNCPACASRSWCAPRPCRKYLYE